MSLRVIKGPTYHEYLALGDNDPLELTVVSVEGLAPSLPGLVSIVTSQRALNTPHSGHRFEGFVEAADFKKNVKRRVRGAVYWLRGQIVGVIDFVEEDASV